MFINDHQKSHVTQLYDSLSSRLILDLSDNHRFVKNYLKGKSGEQKFREWLKYLSDEYLVLSDVILSNPETHCQIDYLVISRGKIIIYEIKNYTGNWILENELLSTESGTVTVANPINQCKRSEAMLRTKLQGELLDYKIENIVIFINEAFNLTSAKLQTRMISHNHLTWHFLSLGQSVQPLDEKDRKIAQQLLKINDLNYRPERLPMYSWGRINRGLTCPYCQLFYKEKKLFTNICENCHEVTSAREAILYAASEYAVLFPDEKITVSKIVDFIDGRYKHVSVRHALQSQYTQIGKTKHTYYR